MKRILLFLMMLTINIVSFAQNSEPEKASPMTDTEIVGKCAIVAGFIVGAMKKQ